MFLGKLKQFGSWLTRGSRAADDLRAQTRELERALARLEAGTSLIRETIASVDETFLLFAPDGTCFASPSTRATEVVGFEPEGRHLCDILRIPAPQFEDTAAWFSMLFDEGHAFDTIRELGPTMISSASAEQFYRVRYFPMRNAGRVENVIVTLLDVTDSMRTRAAQAGAEERSNFVLAIANHRAEFASFVREIQNFAHLAKTLEYDELRRALHTHKGTAAVFYMKPLVAAIHALELDFNVASPGERQGVLLKLEIELPRVVRSFLESERDVLKQLRVFGDRDLIVTERLLANARLMYVGDNARLTAFDDVVRRLRARDLGETLRGFEKHVVDLAGRLSKTMTLEIAADSDFCALLDDAYRPVCAALVHVFDNAIDHGLETTRERLEARKPEYGVLRVGIHRASLDGRRALEIRITDDGRGIDPHAVRAALVRRGIDASQDDDQAILQRVFDLGVSTKAAVNDVSGMGVGLNGLRALVQKSGGSIVVTSRPHVGTTFLIRLPAPEDKVWFAPLDVAWVVAAA